MVKVTDMTAIGSFSLVFSGSLIGQHPPGELRPGPDGFYPNGRPLDTRYLIAPKDHPGRFFHKTAQEIREFLESFVELEEARAWIMTREYSSPPVHEDPPDAPEAPPHVAMMTYIREDLLTPSERDSIASKIFLEVYGKTAWNKPYELTTEDFRYWAWINRIS